MAATVAARALAKRTVLVVGAGPGGLTLANALQRKGVPVKLFDRARNPLGPIGGAFALQSGRDWLDQLGFKEELANRSTAMLFSRILDSKGDVIGEYDMDPPAVKEALNGSVMTAVTRNVLCNMLSERLAPDVLHSGFDLKQISENEDGTITAEFQVNKGDGHFQDHVEDGAVIIGADGIRSKVRDLMHGPRSPNDTGSAAWLLLKRGLLPTSNPNFDFFSKENQGFFFIASEAGSNTGFAGYPASPGTFEFVSFYKLPADELMPSDSWEEVAFGGAKNVERFLERARALPEPFGWLAQSAEASEIVHLGLRDRRNPELAWHLGRVGMLGDAVHAPLPSVGQGVNAAIGDACVLGKYLAAANLESDGDVQEVFRRYEEERRPFGIHIVKQGRQMWGKLPNLLFPQSPETPDNEFEVMIRTWAIKSVELFNTLAPQVIADGLIKEFRAGCGKVDL